MGPRVNCRLTEREASRDLRPAQSAFADPGSGAPTIIQNRGRRQRGGGLPQLSP